MKKQVVPNNEWYEGFERVSFEPFHVLVRIEETENLRRNYLSSIGKGNETLKW